MYSSCLRWCNVGSFLTENNDLRHHPTNSPEMIAAAALQEDVDAVGISILSGAHNTLCPRIVDLLRKNGMTDTLVVVGGIVPDEDIVELKKQGVSEVFLPGTSTRDIIEFLNSNVRN